MWCGIVLINEKPSTNMYQTVLFIDLDGTLMTNPFESAVWPVVINELAQKSKRQPAQILQMIEDENYSRQCDDGVQPILAMDWDDITQSVAERLGVKITANCTELVQSHARSHSSLINYAHEALEELQAPHRALVVATKGLAKYQRPVMDALELTPYFTDILTPDTHNGLKKHRHFFGDWPEQAQQAIMIGDLYHDDVLYPSNHGFKTVWKPRASLLPSALEYLTPFTRVDQYPYTPEQSARPSAIISCLRELSDVIDQIEHHDH